MQQAILLLGPTGSGKTPLGELLEARGLGGRPCVHFDFGQNLRRLALGHHQDAGLTGSEMRILRQMLKTSALLEDEHFPIAAKILRGFLARRNPGGAAWVVLNGLPRHIGQAQGVDRILRTERLVHLTCPADTILRRIRTNAGGDRAGRTDDELQAVRRKLAIFDARTAPLVEHYRLGGAAVHTIEVAPCTTAQDALRALEQRRAGSSAGSQCARI